MSAIDKAKNSLQSARGKAKQVTGHVTRRPATEDSGRRQQVGADLKNAGEQVKDTGHKARKAFGH